MSKLSQILLDSIVILPVLVILYISLSKGTIFDFSSKKKPWKISYAIILYLLDDLVFVYVALLLGIIVHTDISLLEGLFIFLPLYTISLFPINKYLFSKVSKKKLVKYKYFKQLQSIFETALVIVTFSALLATIAGISSSEIAVHLKALEAMKFLQLNLLTWIILLYPPVIPIAGALKFHNVNG